MGIFNRKEKRAAAVEVDDSLLMAILGGSELDKGRALAIPTVQACVNLIADKISMLPVKLFEEQDGEVREVTDDRRLLLLNHDTGDTLNAAELKKRWVQDYFLGKGAYTYIDKDFYGDVKGLYYVDEKYVSAAPGFDPIHKSYMLNVNAVEYYPYQFIKILRNSTGWGKGVSLIAEAPTIMSVAYNTMKLENALVLKGGAKKGFLTSDRKQTEPGMKTIREAWARAFGNSQDAADGIVVLNEGMNFKEFSATSVEMQLNENKQTNASEICKLFLMPPEMISGRATPQAENLMVKNCLMPVINTIETALDSDLLREAEKPYRYFAFDTRELTRGDLKERMATYEIALRNNIMQLDEVREQEDMKPIGFNYLKLGLQDVLYDAANNKIYTPNTNALTDLNSAAANLGETGSYTQNEKTGLLQGDTSEKSVDTQKG